MDEIRGLRVVAEPNSLACGPAVTKNSEDQPDHPWMLTCGYLGGYTQNTLYRKNQGT